MNIRQIAPYVWPSGAGWAIASLSMKPEALAARYGLTFERGETDGLGPYSLAAIALADGSQCWLQYHDDDPSGDTNIWVDDRADLPRSLAMVLDLLGLAAEDLAWINPHSNGVTLDIRWDGLTPQQQDALIEVWGVLDALSASFQRLSKYETSAGTARARAQFLAYFDGNVYRQIARARLLAEQLLVTADDGVSDRLAASIGRAIPYWVPPERAPE